MQKFVLKHGPQELNVKATLKFIRFILHNLERRFGNIF